MVKTAIYKDTLGFLKNLSQNNNREWFNQHKDRYSEALNNILAFAESLLAEMNRHDHIETNSAKDSLFRIYRDVRFSKDQSPYHTYWSGSFKRATKQLRGGYYYHIEPGNSFVAGGFFGPNADDMKRIRRDIEANYTDWEKMLAGKELTETFGGMTGEQVISAPRGYAKDHPAIGLLRFKQFLFRRNFTDEDVCSHGFVKQVSDTYKKMRPFFDYMSEVLTTDANGEPIF